VPKHTIFDENIVTPAENSADFQNVDFHAASTITHVIKP